MFYCISSFHFSLAPFFSYNRLPISPSLSISLFLCVCVWFVSKENSEKKIKKTKTARELETLPDIGRRCEKERELMGRPYPPPPHLSSTSAHTTAVLITVPLTNWLYCCYYYFRSDGHLDRLTRSIPEWFRA